MCDKAFPPGDQSHCPVANEVVVSNPGLAGWLYIHRVELDSHGGFANSFCRSITAHTEHTLRLSNIIKNCWQLIFVRLIVVFIIIIIKFFAWSFVSLIDLSDKPGTSLLLDGWYTNVTLFVSAKRRKDKYKF